MSKLLLRKTDALKALLKIRLQPRFCGAPTQTDLIEF